MKRNWNRWTPKEITRLENLIDKGYNYAAIARRLKRTISSVKGKAQSRRYTVMTAGTLSDRDVQRLLGFKDRRVIQKWIHLGWITARNGSSTDRRTFWRIQEDDLMRFLEDRMHWMTWSPDTITDPNLRAWASELRANHPKWLSTVEVGQRYHVGHNAVHHWIEKGYLPAHRYRNYWVWEADLEHWTPPCMLSKIEWREQKQKAA